MEPQNTLAFVRGQEEYPSVFKSPAHLIPRRLVHIEPAFGFEALERGQRYLGLVSERLLRPT